jgi:hypothetical protein
MEIDTQKIRQQCEGKSKYRLLSNGSIEIDGTIRAHTADSSMGKRITKFWTQWGALLKKSAEKHDIPLPWLVGIVAVESGGNPNACSPCIKFTESGKQICSFAPNCGGECCAYGLMQVINQTARGYCNRSGPSLLGDAAGGIDCGAAVYKAMIKKSKGDPLVAAKRYNGCGGCRGDKSPCNMQGIFGIGGQNNYVENFALSVNAFVQMYPDEVGTGKELPLVFIFAAIGAIGYWYADKEYDLTDKMVNKLAEIF